MSGAVTVTNLTKVYGRQSAVDDLTFEVPWGRVTGFLGPNGAGKTTTLRMILGLVAPTSGDSRIVGTRYSALEDPTRAVGTLLDASQFHPLRSALNHLRICALQSNISPQRVHEVLELVELTSDGSKKVGAFSLGMRQRLGLAAALLGEPRLLILDEPANGLDPSGIRWLRGLLRAYATGESAVFVSSHQLAEIAHVADEVVVIDHGRLVAHDEVAKLVSRAGRGVRVQTEEPERLRDLVISTGAQAELVSLDVVLVRGLSVEEIGRAAAAAQIPLFGLNEEVGTLEDVFFELTRTEVAR
jgi:ABC-2 type transport system ATP-binding protein